MILWSTAQTILNIAAVIPPIILYRFYPTEGANWNEERRLHANLLIAYRKHITLYQTAVV